MFRVISDPDWTAGRAACVDQWDLHAPPEPEPGRREGIAEERKRVRAALDVCHRCPMLDECRAWTFQNRPHGTVSGGMDLSAESPVISDETARDAAILWARVEYLATGASIELNAYQRQYVDEHLHGRPFRWRISGSRPTALRAECDWLLDHPSVGFRRAA